MNIRHKLKYNWVTDASNTFADYATFCLPFVSIKVYHYITFSDLSLSLSVGEGLASSSMHSNKLLYKPHLDHLQRHSSSKLGHRHKKKTRIFPSCFTCLGYNVESSGNGCVFACGWGWSSAHGGSNVRGETLWQRVYSSSHLHLRRITLETIT